MSKANLEARDRFWKEEPPARKEERLQVRSFFNLSSVNEFLRTTPITKVEKLDTDLFPDQRGVPMIAYTIWYWHIIEGEE